MLVQAKEPHDEHSLLPINDAAFPQREACDQRIASTAGHDQPLQPSASHLSTSAGGGSATPTPSMLDRQMIDDSMPDRQTIAPSTPPGSAVFSVGIKTTDGVAHSNAVVVVITPPGTVVSATTTDDFDSAHECLRNLSPVTTTIPAACPSTVSEASDMCVEEAAEVVQHDCEPKTERGFTVVGAEGL